MLSAFEQVAAPCSQVRLPNNGHAIKLAMSCARAQKVERTWREYRLRKSAEPLVLAVNYALSETYDKEVLMRTGQELEENGRVDWQVTI
jgi:hypothetical protein